MRRIFKIARFHPWIGCHYDKCHLGLKVLVLGESHYSWPGGLRARTETTRQALIGGRDNYRFWNYIETLLAGHQPKGTGRPWDSVCFYNYVQHFVGKVPRKRPSEKMWASKHTVNGFQEVLNQCKPDRVLVIGKENWRMLPGHVEYPDNPPIREPSFKLPVGFCAGLDAENEGYAFWYATGCKTYALCAPIFHPAYPRGFHKPETAFVLKRLLYKRWRSPGLCEVSERRTGKSGGE